VAEPDATGLDSFALVPLLFVARRSEPESDDPYEDDGRHPGATYSRGAVRPQRGQTHSVTGCAGDPFRPGWARALAQRVRSRIGPWP